VTMNQAPILVLGARGKTGRRVVARLRELGVPVRAVSRSTGTPFDYGDPATWGPVLDGVQAVYIVPITESVDGAEVSAPSGEPPRRASSASCCCRPAGKAGEHTRPRNRPKRWYANPSRSGRSCAPPGSRRTSPRTSPWSRSGPETWHSPPPRDARRSSTSPTSRTSPSPRSPATPTRAACTSSPGQRHSPSAPSPPYLGLQVVFTNISAILFFGLGGALGNAGWRTPFWLYSVSLVLAVLVAVLIRQPRPREGQSATLPPIPWRTLRVPCSVTLVGGVVFYTPIVELSYILDDIGVESTATIGQVAAVAGVATAVGGFLFGRVSRHGPRILLPIGFGLAGTGLVVTALGSVVAVVAVGAVIASAGTGLLLPTMLTWAISSLGFEERGRGTGLWTAAFSIGQFFCPWWCSASRPC
jgi:hypothetical protein